MMPVGPDLPLSVSTPLRDHAERLRALERPMGPVRQYVDHTATTAAELGLPAAKYPDMMIWLRALRTFVVSDGEDWIRQDTQGAL